MYSTEEVAQAIALSQGLTFALGKRSQAAYAIARITVDYPDGKRQFCQYPESFCEFIEIGDRWEYHRCTCEMNSADLNLWDADQIYRFPDFYDRPVYFARYGLQTALFIDNVPQGFLMATDPPNADDSTDGCGDLHSNVLGWDGKSNDDTPPDDKDTWTVTKDE